MSSIPSTAAEVHEQEDNVAVMLLAAVVSIFLTLVFVSAAVLVLVNSHKTGDQAQVLAGFGILILPACFLPLAILAISHFVRAMSD
jgi:heme/copper-type cytochrome/quinol oxidase subunit 2